jgi:FkbM family methyltransferase
LLSEIKQYAGDFLLRKHHLLRPFMRDRHSAYRCPGGKIYLNLRESPMMVARAFDLYEPAKMAAVRHFLKPGMTFVDVGGNKGDFALLAARITGRSGTVLCFEPEPENCHWIRKSIELNGYENINLNEIALSDRDGTAQLYLGRKSGWHTLLSGQQRSDAGTILVRTAMLDSILAKLSIAHIDVMKIDVEGAELQVLEGARKTLWANSRIVLLLDVHPRMGVNPKQVGSLLTKMGFSIHAMDHPLDSPMEITDHSRELVAYRALPVQSKRIA